MWLHNLILLSKVLVSSLSLPRAVHLQGVALDEASLFVWLHQHHAGLSSSGYTCHAGSTATGAWQAAGAEGSADSGYHNLAIKILSLFDSFRCQHQSCPFCLKKLSSCDVYFRQSPRPKCTGIVHIIVKNIQKNFVGIFL